MSFDIFLQSFRSGDAADGDTHAVRAVLEPMVVERREGWARIATSDGEADVYGLDSGARGLMINRASGRAIWDVMFDVADSAGFVVILDGRACLPRAEMFGDLPPELIADAVVVASGAALLGTMQPAGDAAAGGRVVGCFLCATFAPLPRRWKQGRVQLDADGVRWGPGLRQRDVGLLLPSPLRVQRVRDVRGWERAHLKSAFQVIEVATDHGEIRLAVPRARVPLVVDHLRAGESPA